MNYALVLVTHGRDPEPLNRTLEAFWRHVRPRPAVILVEADGEPAVDRTYQLARSRPDVEWILGGSNDQRGFCEATREAWQSAAQLPDVEYVFWLEHDFEVLRHVNVQILGDVLDRHPLLAQMQLMRDAVNEAEKQAGGLYEYRRGEYADRGGWLEHTAYLTTNVNVMRRGFMQENPWPFYGDQCEGRFGIDVRNRGYSFAVWGAGEPWTRHIGERNGFGY